MGRAASLLFAQEGAHVGVLDIDGERARKVADDICLHGGHGIGIQADVASSSEVAEAVRRVVESFGGLHILYNNAAIWVPDDASAFELDEEVWAHVIAVNLTGVFLCCKHAIPAIMKSGGGSIINTASPVATRPEVGQDAYTASKGGVVSFSWALAQRHARDNIRVNVLMPGIVETAMNREHLRNRANREFALRSTPLGRLGDPQDVARAALFLASDESTWVTGTSQWVDGGWSLGATREDD
jgi:NAD(P)-dependent dehydrogenase (short-subunit alcohol dehydrogenase family)